MRKVCFVCLLVIALVEGGFAAAQSATAPQRSPKSNASASTPATGSDEGEKRFELQCGRCHVPPESLSPREAKAVVRQMRVRANLTAEDERLILKYLAP